MVARDTQVLSDAKSYTDTAVSNLIDGAPGILNTLKELASAIGGDDNYFVHVSEQLAALSAASSATNAGEVLRATNAESQLNTDLGTEVSRAQGAESALSDRVSDVEGNYLDKRVGGTVAANLAVTGTLEVGSGATTLFVGEGVIGVNTEAPEEALHVVGNGKFSGNLIGSGSSSITGFIMDGGSF